MAKYLEVEYKDLFLNTWRVDIFDEDYTEPQPFTATGYASIKRPSTKLMDVIKGSSLEINLDADTSSDYYKRFAETVGDKKFKVKFYKNDVIFWTGFLKPDGIIESFVTDKWLITITAVDGLGYLKNIEFKNENSEVYRGSQSEKTLLERCLSLTGLDIDYQLFSIDLIFTVNEDRTYTGLNNKPILDTYVNAERYIQDDLKKTVFDAEKVLKAILAKYGCFIFQEDGVWKIQRMRDLLKSSSNNYGFVQYDISGNQVTAQPSNSVLKTIGSQINNFTSYHATGNQLKRYSSAIGAYKVIFDYGLVKSILKNSNVVWDTVTEISDWEIGNIGYFFNQVVNGQVVSYIKANFAFDGTGRVAALTQTTDQDVQINDTVEISVEYCVEQRNYRLGASIIVRLIDNTDPTNIFFLNLNGVWENSDNLPVGEPLIQYHYSESNAYEDNETEFLEGTFNLTANTAPVSGILQVEILKPAFLLFGRPQRPDDYILLKNITIAGIQATGITGESYTAKRTDLQIAVIENKLTLEVGDQASDIYIGGIEDIEGRNTLYWKKPSDTEGVEVHPLLFWLAFERLKMAYGNALNFTGDIYGAPMPYSGKLNIDNVEGNFITLEYSYNTKTGLIAAKHVRVFDDVEVNPQDEIFVEFNIEGENVVEPAINP